MFVTAQVVDALLIAPSEFGKDVKVAAADEIEKRYLDTVIENTGLVVSLHAVDKVSEGEVLPDEGSARVQVAFRLMVFSPWVGEVIYGKIKHMGEYGVCVTLGFFNDVVVPSSLLPKPHVFKENSWVWLNEGDEFAFELGDVVACEVCSVRYRRKAPDNKEAPSVLAANQVYEQERERRASHTGEPADDVLRYPPMEVIAKMDSDGLGPSVWWREEDEEEDEDEEALDHEVPPSSV